MQGAVGWVAAMAVAAAASGTVVHAQAPSSAPPGVISRADDLERTCESLAAEAATLSETMGATNEPSLFGRLGGLARTGAQLLPGGALVVAGADVVTGPDRERRDAQSDAVRYRWHYLNGMYLGRGCEPPPVAASIEPPPAPSSSPSENVVPEPVAPPPVSAPPLSEGLAAERLQDGAAEATPHVTVLTEPPEAETPDPGAPRPPTA